MSEFNMKEHLEEAHRNFRERVEHLKSNALANYKHYLETGDKASLLLAEQFATTLHTYLEIE